MTNYSPALAIACSSIPVSLLTKDGDKNIDKKSLDGAIASFFYSNYEDKRVLDGLDQCQKYFEPVSHGKFLQYAISWVKMGEDHAYVAHIKGGFEVVMQQCSQDCISFPQPIYSNTFYKFNKFGSCCNFKPFTRN